MGELCARVIILIMDDDFVEVTNELPYRQIKFIKILSVTYENDKFSIVCRCDVEGSDPDAQTFHRTEDDVRWLIENIANNKKTFLAPKINSQTYLSLLYQKMSAQQGTKFDFQKKLIQKMVERALNIVTTIILPHVKALGNQYVNPIFIFFNKKFGLYKNPIYYKEESTPIVQRISSFVKLSYANYSNKSAGWEDVQKCKSVIISQKEQFQQTRTKLGEYCALLGKLQEWNMGEKDKIKNQINLVQKLLFTYQNQVRYLEMVVEEVQQCLVKIDNKAVVEQMMKNYGLFLNEEVQLSARVGTELVKEFVQVMCSHQWRIRITAH